MLSLFFFLKQYRRQHSRGELGLFDEKKREIAPCGRCVCPH